MGPWRQLTDLLSSSWSSLESYFAFKLNLLPFTPELPYNFSTESDGTVNAGLIVLVLIKMLLATLALFGSLKYFSNGETNGEIAHTITQTETLNITETDGNNRPISVSVQHKIQYDEVGDFWIVQDYRYFKQFLCMDSSFVTNSCLLKLADHIPPRCLHHVQDLFDFVSDFDFDRSLYLAEFLSNFFLDSKQRQQHLFSVIKQATTEVLEKCETVTQSDFIITYSRNIPLRILLFIIFGVTDDQTNKKFGTWLETFGVWSAQFPGNNFNHKELLQISQEALDAIHEYLEWGKVIMAEKDKLKEDNSLLFHLLRESRSDLRDTNFVLPSLFYVLFCGVQRTDATIRSSLQYFLSSSAARKSLESLIRRSKKSVSYTTYNDLAELIFQSIPSSVPEIWRSPLMEIHVEGQTLNRGCLISFPIDVLNESYCRAKGEKLTRRFFFGVGAHACPATAFAQHTVVHAVERLFRDPELIERLVESETSQESEE